MFSKARPARLKGLARHSSVPWTPTFPSWWKVTEHCKQTLFEVRAEYTTGRLDVVSKWMEAPIK